MSVLCRTVRRCAVSTMAPWRTGEMRSGGWKVVNRSLTNSAAEPHLPVPKHILSPFERIVVRVTRSYKGSDVPRTISPEAMDKANSRFRIGLMMSTMVFTLVGCVVAIRQGRKESKDPNNMVHSRNINRYKSR